MMVNRRTFILGTALVATAPTVAKLLELSSTAKSDQTMLPVLSPPQPAADRIDSTRNLFRIDGWERRDDDAIDGSTLAVSHPPTHVPADEQVLISLNRSWRAAWR